jgi:hypothetical protein
VAAGLHRLLPSPDHRQWHPCGMASKKPRCTGHIVLSSTLSLRWLGPLIQTALQTALTSVGWTTSRSVSSNRRRAFGIALCLSRRQSSVTPICHAPPQEQTPDYPPMISCFSEGIFRSVDASRFKCALAISGGIRRIQLFREISINRGALNISRNNTSVLPVFSM